MGSPDLLFRRWPGRRGGGDRRDGAHQRRRSEARARRALGGGGDGQSLHAAPHRRPRAPRAFPQHAAHLQAAIADVGRRLDRGGIRRRVDGRAHRPAPRRRRLRLHLRRARPRHGDVHRRAARRDRDSGLVRAQAPAADSLRCVGSCIGRCDTRADGERSARAQLPRGRSRGGGDRRDRAEPTAHPPRRHALRTGAARHARHSRTLIARPPRRRAHLARRLAHHPLRLGGGREAERALTLLPRTRGRRCRRRMGGRFHRAELRPSSGLRPPSPRVAGRRARVRWPRRSASTTCGRGAKTGSRCRRSAARGRARPSAASPP